MCHFIFSKSVPISPAFQKQHFASVKSIGVPQKKEKCHFSFSLIEWHFFMYFYVPFNFFKVPFDFASLPKGAFCKDKAHRGTPKGAKMSLLFSLIERHFYVPFNFFKVPFDVACLPRAAFCKAKLHRGTPKGGKMSVLCFSNRMAFSHALLRGI